MSDAEEPKLKPLPAGSLLRVPAHSHEHGHTHGRGHEHTHEHDWGTPAPTQNSRLEPGAGSGRVLLLDTPSGIAGDMTVAALIDLGVPLSVVEDAVARLHVSGCRVRLEAARAGAIGGARFVVEETAPQPARIYRDIDALIASSSLSAGVVRLSRRIFERLARAEAEVHRVPIESVAFHEVGAIDAIVDIVAAAACFEYLGARVVATPLPIGRGFVRCQHGRLPLPAPATLLCLAGVPTYDAGIEGELVTPTGAAIVATLADEFVSWPSFVPERTGFGCGTKKLADRPNALRAVLGSVLPSQRLETSHVVLEANVDDMTGELSAHAISVLLGEGALDAWAQPITMKKGRPGLTLSVLAARERADALTATMLRETSSIGVRRTDVSRSERPRRMIEVDTRFGKVPVKVSEGGYGPPQRKPEFDECARLAVVAGVPVREVIAAALAALSDDD